MKPPDVVVKVGGALLRHPRALDRSLAVLAAAAPAARIVLVPGGGPFADAVRAVDRALGVPPDASHWMAVLAMDQYAHLLAARLHGGCLVDDPSGIAAALDGGCVPVLAPSRWLRGADPLPHSWEVTSDSIAAWIAGRLGAVRLVLVKPPGARGPDLVDPYFARALSQGLAATIVPADDEGALRRALAAEAEQGQGSEWL